MSANSGIHGASDQAASPTVSGRTYRGSGRRIAVSAALVAAATVPILLALLTLAADVVDTPMAVATPGWRAQTVALLETAGPPPPVYTLRLQSGERAGLLEYSEIQILFTTHGERVSLNGATLELLGTSCRYEAPSGATLADDRLLRFIKGPGCDSDDHAPAGELKLTVRTANRAPLGVWTFVPPSGVQATASMIRLVSIPGYTGPEPALRGKFVNYTRPSGLRRIDLLNYVWQVSPSTAWLWFAMIAAASCGLAGAWLLLSRARGETGGPSAQQTLATTAGMFLLAASIGVSYAVVVPPFQAADEPDHFLSYAWMIGDSSLPATSAQWARLSHFERLQFHSDERFRPVDVGKPMATSWNEEIFAENVVARSTTTALWWRALSKLPVQLSAQRQLLWMRLANVLLFAFCVACAAALLQLTAPDEVVHPTLLGGAFLLVPSLPFFATYVSEFAILCSIYVLLSACLLALLLDGPRSFWLGAPLGIIVAVMMASGRSALPMLPIVTAALAARIALGDRERTPIAGHWSRSVTFWGGLSISFATLTLALNAEYPRPADLFPEVAEKTLLPAFRWVWNNSWVLVAAGMLGLLLEWSALKLRNAIAPLIADRMGRAAAWFCYAGAALVAVSFIGSLLADYPRLQTLELPNRTPVVEYVKDVLAVSVTTFRLSAPDLLMTYSFVAGFGWVDTLPHKNFVIALVAVAGTALMGLLVFLGRRGDLRRVVWLILIGIGWLATMSLYAVATHGMSRNVHGRYLIGPYLCAIAVVLSVTALKRWRGLERLRLSPVAVLLVLAAGIHAYCLRVILVRYF